MIETAPKKRITIRDVGSLLDRAYSKGYSDGLAAGSEEGPELEIAERLGRLSAAVWYLAFSFVVLATLVAVAYWRQ